MRRMLLLGVVIWAAVFNAACSDVYHLEGKYQSLPSADRFVLLELQPNGQGTWETDFDMVAFRLEGAQPGYLVAHSNRRGYSWHNRGQGSSEGGAAGGRKDRPRKAVSRAG